jgi:hypothetical protein
VVTARRSRGDILPLAWEVPVAGLAGGLLAAAMLLLAGRGVASALGGDGFLWPHGGPPILASIGGLLTGHIDRGLTAAEAGRLPSPLVVYTVIVASEVVLVGVMARLVLLWWRHLGPGARDGMASRAEVEAVLGVANLRRRRALIRPDLHGSGGDGDTGGLS